MKIGVFDSGLGGLIITKAFINAMPEYDYLYYGDSANLPYGDKTGEQIMTYTLEAMKYLIKNDCKLIIVACNTATSVCLRYIQQSFIPAYAPQIKVLGVVIPTVEVAVAKAGQKVGVIATSATVRSHIYREELHKITPSVEVVEQDAPELVPLIENNDFAGAFEAVKKYSARFSDCDSLILGCTHYPLLKDFFRQLLPTVEIVAQDELMAAKLADYLHRHQEIDCQLSRNADYTFKVSSLEAKAQKVADGLFSGILLSRV